MNKPQPQTSPPSVRHTVALHLHPGQEAVLRMFVHALAQARETVRINVSGISTGSVDALIHAYGLQELVDRGRPETGAVEEVVTREELLTLLARARNADVHIGSSEEPPEGLTLADIVESLGAGTTESAPRSLPVDLAGERVAIITNIPNHYRVPLFNELAERLDAAGATLRVLFLGQTYARRSWVDLPEMHFDHHFLTSLGIKLSRAWHPFVPKDLESSLKSFAPTTVICAGFSPLVAGRAARSARKLGAGFGIWSGETSTGITGSNRMRMVQRRMLLRRADAALAYGSRAEDYLRNLRADLPVVHVRNTTTLPAERGARADRERIELLSVAELRHGKRIDLILDAVARCDDLNLHLTVIGEGPLRTELEERAAGLGDRVTFTGAVPPSQIGSYFGNADVFLFPSEIDVFGLVVVEALGAGLATLVGRDPGVTADLCADGLNSVVVPQQSPSAWSDALRRVVEDENLRTQLSIAARRTIQTRWTVRHSAEAFVDGIRAVKEAR